MKAEIIDKNALLNTCDEILMIYMSKGVHNVFKVTLLELLNKKLRYKDTDICKYVEIIIKLKDGMEAESK
jgi:hypothetical protein